MASRGLRGGRSGRPDTRVDDSIAASVAGGDLDCGSGNLGNLRPILGDAGGVSYRHGGGGRNRAYQLDRKPRRLRGPVPVGMVKQATHSFAGGMIMMAASLVVAGILALTLPVALRETNPS